MISSRVTIAAALLAAASSSTRPVRGAERVDFTRQVRPILAAKCLHCHGQDPSHREANLRLDVYEAPDDETAGAASVITPGDAEGSELISRITSDDADLHMPPVASDKTLKPEEIEILRRWVEQGAEYKKHWSFVAPQRPAVPQVSDAAWVRNPIDAFVLARLEAEGLKPSPIAADNALLRRLSLDLVGLPPTLEELAAYESLTHDDPQQACDVQIDRLLASPHFGERWARLWLDAARYADSDGFEKDKPRFVWHYRDWVINAINADKPYDDFIIEQIAGDMLPDATQDQRVATGFLRNSMINEEGGIDPEQFRMEALFDRMDAIGKSVLGLTVQCAQCHTHKYDPISHEEYYRLLSFLNDDYEAISWVYSKDQLQQIEAIHKEDAKLEAELKQKHVEWQSKIAHWEEKARAAAAAWHQLPPLEPEWIGGLAHPQALPDNSVLTLGF